MLDLTYVSRVAIESSSAILCFVLVWFMAKPFRLTGDARFLGLPLGFGIMGIGHVIAATITFFEGLSWFMLTFRTFSFVFLAMTYFFSGRASKKSQQLWNITFSFLIVFLITLSLLVFVAPQSVWDYSGSTQIYLRIFMQISLLYIVLYTLRSHVRHPDPMTLWIPFGFIFLALSQYSFSLFYIDYTAATFWGAVAFRFAGLIVFLIVSYQTFYRFERNTNNEKVTS